MVPETISVENQRMQSYPGYLQAWNFTSTVISEAHGKVRGDGLLGVASSASGTGSRSQPHSMWPSEWRREACECSRLLQLVHLTLGSAFPGTRRTLRTMSDVSQICQMWEPAWVMSDHSLRNVFWVIWARNTGCFPCYLGLEAPKSTHQDSPSSPSSV